MMATDQRRNRYVDPVVQGLLARRLIIHWLLFLLASAFIAVILQFLSDPFQSWPSTLVRAWWTHGPVILVGLCLIPVFIADTIRLSHRFVGPLVRIRRVLSEAGRGESVQPLTLRPTDYWQELAQDVNLACARLNRCLETQPATTTDSMEQRCGARSN